MGSDQSFVDYVMDQLSGLSGISYRKMFGEYAVYLDGKVVLLICDNQAFVKNTPLVRSFASGCDEAPPYSGAKPHILLGDAIEDRDWFKECIRMSWSELPVPKPKKPKGIKRAKS